MKTRSLIALMSTTLLAAGVISASTAAASHSPHPSSQAGDVFLLLTAKQTTSTYLDLNKKGSQGDEFVFTEALFLKGQGQVGHDVGVCTLSNKNVSQCLVTASFPAAITKIGGASSLVAQGTTDQRHVHNMLAVTGGSGEFLGASGQVQVTSVSNTKAALLFDFLPVPVPTKVFN